MERFAGFVLAMVMVLAMTVTVFGATITITGGADGATYSAYKLLHATDGGDGKFAYTLNDKYEGILKTVTGKTTETEIVAYISALDTSEIRTFADTVYKNIIMQSIAADYTTDTGSIADVGQGYYLIAETALGSDAGGATDSYSLVMLDTAGNTDITINTKEGVPTVTKTVQEKNDSISNGTTEEQTSADYDIGDEMAFTLTGTVSGQIASYEKYYYQFVDTMTNMTYVADSVKVMVDGVEKTGNFVTEWDAENKKLTVTCEDIKDLGVTLTPDSKIVVTYKATLDESAVSGTTGNRNSVLLNYSNDPYNYKDGAGDFATGATPTDSTVVFTYKVVVNKVDGDGNALSGAGFTLYKYNGTDYEPVGPEMSGNTTFTFHGLDAGKYKLVETTVPNGYNKVADIEFEVISTITGDPGTMEKLEVKDVNGTVIGTSDTSANPENPIFSVTLNDGTLTTDVKNQAGTELPETGGTGTGIFYIAGAILALGAGIVFVVKRGVNRND